MAGLKRFPNIAGVIVLTAFFGVLGYFIFTKRTRQQDNKNDAMDVAQSIAVLPFVNLGKDTTQEYFSDGLIDGILSSLGQEGPYKGGRAVESCPARRRK